MFEKKVVITGSSKGFGRALAEEFLRHGNRVVLNSHNAANVQRAYRELYPLYGDKCDYVVGDVSNRHDSNRIAEYAKKNMGSVDIWINNAGTNGYRRGTVLSMSEDKVQNVVETNLLGTIYGSQSALEVMEKDGILINLEGSGCDPMSSVPGYAVYESTKVGIKHFTKSLQGEMRESLFKIGTVSPGMIMTDMLTIDNSSNTLDILAPFASTPDTVAKYVYHQIEDLRDTGFRIEYLTFSRIIKVIFSMPFRKKVTREKDQLN